jgi:vesicle coat complex subunit
MGLTLEHEAKVPVMEAARKDLVALLRDPSPFIAENALVAIQNCCEEPAAKKLVVEVMSERDQAFVFNPQVMA